MSGLLEYRDGAEGDVDPVLIDRRGDGTVRVVVRYPRQAKVRARNRLVVTVHFFILWHVMLYWFVRAYPNSLFGLVASLWLIWVIAVGAMTTLWWRTKWVYVFEAKPSELYFQTRGIVFTRRRRYPRELVIDVRVELGYHDEPRCLLILTPRVKLTRRFLDFIGEQHLIDVADALRQGLAMPATMEVA